MVNSLTKLMITHIINKGGNEMLLQFSCSNYKSIKEKVTFSMVSPNKSSNNSRVKEYNGLYITRIAAIYGANGSGKSNFISAIELARNIIVNSINHQPGQSIVQFPHKLSEPNTPSIFEFQFVVDSIRYAYGFSIVNGDVNEEYLYYFPKKRKLKIFERQGMSIIPGNKYKSVFKLSFDVLKENRLFLSCAANYSRVHEVEKAFLFFQQQIVIYRPNAGAPVTDNWFTYSVQLMDASPTVKNVFITVLQALGTGIKDIETKIVNVSTEQATNTIPEPIKNILKAANIPKVAKQFKGTIIYDQFTTDLLTEESTGIQKLFQIICPIIDILVHGKILICDELETGLHEMVVHEIIKIFYGSHPEQFAQLIFTTHDTALLDLDLFERDQIWFTQLTDKRATDLYSLVEIRNVRKTEKYSKGYIQGKYGAIPVLNQEFQQKVASSEVDI